MHITGSVRSFVVNHGVEYLRNKRVRAMIKVRSLEDSLLAARDTLEEVTSDTGKELMRFNLQQINKKLDKAKTVLSALDSYIAQAEQYRDEVFTEFGGPGANSDDGEVAA